MTGIFLNYRRDDSAGYAGRVYDKLCHYFDHRHVFMDVDTLNPGAAYVDEITRAIDSCVAMLTLIGPKWLSVTDENNNPRIQNPEDLVRKEISAALKRDILVIPLLLPGASMPSFIDLPDEIKTLALRHAMRLSEDNFHRDMEDAIRVIKADLRGNLEKTVKVHAVPILKRLFISSLLGLGLTIPVLIVSEITLGWYFTAVESAVIFGACVTLVLVTGILLRVLRNN